MISPRVRVPPCPASQRIVRDSGIHFVGDKQTIRARRGQPIGSAGLGEVGGGNGARGYGPELMSPSGSKRSCRPRPSRDVQPPAERGRRGAPTQLDISDSGPRIASPRMVVTAPVATWGSAGVGDGATRDGQGARVEHHAADRRDGGLVGDVTLRSPRRSRHRARCCSWCRRCW